MKKFYTKEYIINNRKLKKPLTIAHISDLHFYKDMNPALLYDIAYEFEKTNPEIICFTGDLLEDARLIENKKNRRILLKKNRIS